MAVDIDREQIIFTCTMVTNYAESYLESLSDDELLKVYERIMNKELKPSGKYN